MVAYLREHRDKVVSRWSELAVAGIAGRLSADEVRRELEDLYSLVMRVMAGADADANGELRATLDDMSRSRGWPSGHALHDMRWNLPLPDVREAPQDNGSKPTPLTMAAVMHDLLGSMVILLLW
jgi:hypothetical protein